MQDVKALWELQLMDNNLIQLEKDLKTPPLYSQLKKLKGEIEIDQDSLRKGMLERESLDKKIKGLEMDCLELKEKMVAISTKLYSGEVSNPKELDGMNHNLEVFQAKLNETEDILLVLMESKEELEKKFSQENQVLADKKQHFRQLNIQYQNRQDQKKSEINETELNKARLLDSIDKPVLKKYNELKNKLINPVAKAVEGMCSGCHMAVSFAVLKDLKADGGLVFCDNCGRMLWLV